MKIFSNRKVIVYVAGGITYAELAALQAGCENTIIGSSNVMSPTDFLESLAAP
jgi:hypothetical protein